MELDPKYLPAVINLAATYHSRGDQAKAAVWVKKALALNPNPQEKAQIDKLLAGGAAGAPKKSPWPVRLCGRRGEGIYPVNQEFPVWFLWG